MSHTNRRATRECPDRKARKAPGSARCARRPRSTGACGNAAPVFQLVGFTSATFQGTGTGVLGLTRACQAEFPHARVCTSADVLATTDVPTLSGSDAWVIPTLVSGGGGSWLIDVSGITFNSAMVCNGASGGYGLTVSVNGVFGGDYCTSQRAVACCASS